MTPVKILFNVRDGQCFRLRRSRNAVESRGVFTALCLSVLASVLVSVPCVAEHVIGDFESSFDGWTVAWDGTDDFSNSTTGVTLGSQSLAVLVDDGDFWVLQHNGLLDLSTATYISFDLTFVASEWPADTQLLVNKLALMNQTSWLWQEVPPAGIEFEVISGNDPPAPNGDGIVVWQPSLGDVTWTVSFRLAGSITYTTPDTYQLYIALQSNQDESVAGRFYIDNIHIVSEATDVTVVMGNWEGSNLDGWSAAWDGSPVLSPGDTNGVTLDDGALSVTTTGGYYCLQWAGSPITTDNATLLFDLTMLASEWAPGSWTKVADKIALLSDGPSGWMEFSDTTAINRDDESDSTLDWTPDQGDARKTFSVDISSYNATGATWFMIIIAIQGGDGSGHFYFDNARLFYPAQVPPPARLHVEDNLLKNFYGTQVILRGVSLIDAGFLQDWQGGLTNMIDRLTDPNDTNCDSVGWRTNVIRIPVVPPENVGYGWPYPFDPDDEILYGLLRSAVTYCAEKGVYALIDWHDIADMTPERVAAANVFWEYMAPRFADDTHVMFELFNEPINNDGTDEENWTEVKTAMETLVATVRTYAPETVLFVGTPQWCQIIGPTATDPLDDDNIVYVSHIYPWHWINEADYHMTNLAAAAAAHPVVLGEWGYLEDGSGGTTDGNSENYAQPLMDFIEGLDLGIGSIAWVASYDWGPPMYEDPAPGESKPAGGWPLLDFGCFVKDYLYDMWLTTQDTNIPLTINRCVVTAGRTRGRDHLEASGTFSAIPALLYGVEQMDVNIVNANDGNVVYNGDVNYIWDTSGNRFIWSTRTNDEITLLIIDFTRKTFVLKIQNVSLWGLEAPVRIDLILRDFVLSGQVDEDVIARHIPAKLMSGYGHSLYTTLIKAVNKSYSLKDKLIAKGEIAVRDVNINLAAEEVVITWSDVNEETVETFTIPAGAFVASSRGHVFKCSRALTSEGARVTATVNLDKCTFKATIYNTDLSVTEGDAKFSVTFADFDETDELSAVPVTRPTTTRRFVQ